MEIINRLYSHFLPYNYVISSYFNSGLGHLPCFGQRDVGRSLTRACKLPLAFMHDWVWTLLHSATTMRTHWTNPPENDQSMQLRQVAKAKAILC